MSKASAAKWNRANAEKMRAYRRQHYREHPAPYKARAKAARIALKAWFKALKTATGCARCSETFWACLEYHHVSDDKEFTLADAFHRNYGMPRILAEIAKCILLCANCHRKEHYQE